MKQQQFGRGFFPARFFGVLLSVYLLGTCGVRAQGQGIEIFCPPDVTLGCTDPTDPTFTGEPGGVTDCSLVPERTEAPPPGDGGALSFFFEDSFEFSDCPGDYTILRNWTAFDECEQQASCVQRISIVGPGPDIICPPDVEVSCNDSLDPLFTGEATATDVFCVQPQAPQVPAALNGGPSVNFSDVVLSGNCPSEFVIQRIWIATDLCQRSSLCTQTISVVDGIAPEVFCPVDLTLSCSDSTEPEFTGFATATDNCEFILKVAVPPPGPPGDGAPTVTYTDEIVPGQCPASRQIRRIWTATDLCEYSSSCTQTLTIVDSTAPVLTCPPDRVLTCTDPTGPSFTGQATATDDCATVINITSSDRVQPGQCPNVRVIQRTWTADDGCGNIATCTQTLTVRDTIPPVITCPPDLTVPCGSSLDPAVTGQATATDNCSSPTIQALLNGSAGPTITFTDTTIPGECPVVFVIRRVWTATDSCQNSASCTQIITVEDRDAPSLTCELPPTLLVQPTAILSPTDCEALVPDLRQSASPQDTCLGEVQVTQSPPPGAFFTNGVTVVLRAQDGCGNVSEAVCDLFVVCSTESACQLTGTVCLLPADAEIEDDSSEAAPPPGSKGSRCLEQAGVTVRMISALTTAAVQVVVTDSNGVYRFDAQPAGPYYLEVDETTLPPGAELTEFSSNPTGTFNYDPVSQACPVFEFIYIQRLNLCGAVWYDINGNGIANENLALNGLNGVAVRLRQGGSGALLETTRTTNGTCEAIGASPVRGTYVFEFLPVGNYTVEVDPVDVSAALVDLLNMSSFVVPPGFIMTTPVIYQVNCGPFGCVVNQPVPGLPAVANFGMRYEPTAITLASFEAARGSGGVQVKWTTALEFENLGFHVYRAASPEGPRQRVNADLIPGQGTGEGRSYELLDSGAPEGVVYYWLEEIDWSFVATLHGPVVALPAGAEVVRVTRMEAGSPMVLWSQGAPGAGVLLQYAERLSPAPVWLPVPGSATVAEDQVYETLFSLPGEAPIRFFRVIHIRP